MKKPYKLACTTLLVVVGLLSMLLFMYYNRTYTITFDTKGGTIYASVELKPNEKVSSPGEPVLEGHTFAGWVIKGTNSPYDFNLPVTDDLTIEAKWTSIF